MDIQNHGQSAVLIPAGHCIEVVAYAVGEATPFNIIYYGGRSHYNEIKEQERHFITHDSREFRGSHTTDG